MHAGQPIGQVERLREAGVQTLLGLLETGITDVAIVTLPVEDEHLTVVPLFTEEMVVAVWRGHPRAAAGGTWLPVRCPATATAAMPSQSVRDFWRCRSAASPERRSRGPP